MEYGQKADLWSAGILSYQLLTGRLPFIGENGLLANRLYTTKQTFSNKDVFRAILYADLDFSSSPWDELSENARDLVESLLTRDPAHRPTAAEALRHPWFVELDRCSIAGGKGGNGSNGRGRGGACHPAILDTVVQRLQRFGTYGRLKQVALRGIASAAFRTTRDVEMFKEIEASFRMLDRDGNGRVPVEAMGEYLENGGFDLSAEEIEVLVSQMDIEGTGYIVYDEWLAAMLEWRLLQESAEWGGWVHDAFKAFDKGDNGSITVQDLSAMLCKDGACAMPDTVGSALRYASSSRCFSTVRDLSWRQCACGFPPNLFLNTHKFRCMVVNLYLISKLHRPMRGVCDRRAPLFDRHSCFKHD
jgi:calcium-dependent protein kinase